MNRIVLIRHVETAMAGRFCGHSDPEPNLSGERQIGSVVKQVASLGIERIYSSDLRRAAQTAAAIEKSIGIAVELRPRLREIDFGLWEGLSWEEIERRFPAEAKLWVEKFPLETAPGGEAYADFRTRVESELIPLLGEARNWTTAVVTHRGVLQYALTRFFDLTAQEARERTAPYGAVVVAIRGEDDWQVLP